MLKPTLLAPAGAAIAELTACGRAAIPSAADAGYGSAHVSIGCIEQFNAWSDGQSKGVLAAIDAVSSAAAGGDAQVLTATPQNNQVLYFSGCQPPLPSCTDPGKYWLPLMMHVSAATNTKSVASVRAAIKGVSEIAQHLTAELKAL
jgi:hypothetical protein